MSILGTLVPEHPCYVFDTHTHKDTQDTLRQIDWHNHINVYQHHLSYAYSSYLYCTEWFTDTKKILSTISFLLKNYSLVENLYLFIRCNKTKFFLGNTNNADRNGVHKENTHTKHLEKDNIGKGGGNYEPGYFWIFIFWQCKRSK